MSVPTTRVQYLQQEIASRHEMLADVRLVNALPDKGQRIRNKVELLEGELRELLAAADHACRPTTTPSPCLDTPVGDVVPLDDPYAQAQAYYFDRDKHKTRDLDTSVKRMFALHTPGRQAEQARQRHAKALSVTEAQELYRRNCERQAEAERHPRPFRGPGPSPNPGSLPADHSPSSPPTLASPDAAGPAERAAADSCDCNDLASQCETLQLHPGAVHLFVQLSHDSCDNAAKT
eukprot:EG_transcript_25626